MSTRWKMRRREVFARTAAVAAGLAAPNLIRPMQAWAARDQKLESVLRLNTRLLQEAFIDKGRAQIVRQNDFGVLSVLIWVATLIGLGIFVAKK